MLDNIYGNVWEWCDSRRQPYISDCTIDEPTKNILITDSVAMIKRGGSFSYDKETMRSAHRGALNYFPNQRRDNVGFRIAKTMGEMPKKTIHNQSKGERLRKNDKCPVFVFL